MDSTTVLVSVAGFAAFLFIALEEIPWSLNVVRVERKIRRTSRRRGSSAHEALFSLRRQTRMGAWVLLGFAIASAVFVATRLVTVGGGDTGFGVIAASLVLGLLVLSLAFLFLAPRLFDAVAKRLESASATPNSHTPDAEAPHGAGPRL